MRLFMRFHISVRKESEKVIIDISGLYTHEEGEAKFIRDAASSWRRAGDWMKNIFCYPDRIYQNVSNTPHALNSTYMGFTSPTVDAALEYLSIPYNPADAKLLWGRALYTLPTSSDLALDFLAVMDDMAVERGVTNFTVNDVTSAVETTERKSTLSQMLARAILSLDLPPTYSHAREVIHKILTETERSAITFRDCQDRIRRRGILTDHLFHLGDQQMSVAEKMQHLYVLVRELTAAQKYPELTQLLNNFNRATIYKLLAPCIGKVAFDRTKYHWAYTELNVLTGAIFSVRADGRVGIQMEHNVGYQRHYARGKSNHRIMKDEFKHLFNILELEYERDCDFHKEIVFTRDCSQRLLAMGVHIDANYVKKLLAVKNNIGFFAQACRDPNNRKAIVCLTEKTLAAERAQKVLHEEEVRTFKFMLSSTMTAPRAVQAAADLGRMEDVQTEVRSGPKM